MRAAFAGDKAAERQLTIASSACLAVGIIVIVVGAIAGWGWMRIIGATLITVGSAGLGSLIAFVEPRRREVRARIAASRTLIAVIVAVVFVLPVAIALVGAIVGLFVGGGSAGLRTLGALVALVLLAATLASTLIAVRATQQSGRMNRQTTEES